MAACMYINQDNWTIEIPNTQETDGVVYYMINIAIGSVKWRVGRRFKEFAQIHEYLMTEHGIPKDILPPKQLFPFKKEENFIAERRQKLTCYLNNVVRLLWRTMPLPFVYFLHIDKYELMFILKVMTNDLLTSRPAPSFEMEMDLIQAHSVSVRLKLPCPPVDMLCLQHDYCIILDFCSQIKTLSIVGRDSYGDSNIESKSLLIDFVPFKSLSSLTLKNIDLKAVNKADDLRQNLKTLKVINSRMNTITDILLCDSIHKDVKQVLNTKSWPNLAQIDFSYNELSSIGDSVLLMPNVKSLILSANHISSSQSLHLLTDLTELSLSENRVISINDLNLSLKNLSYLDLSQNNICSLQGLETIFSLCTLNVSSNNIHNIDEIEYIKNLPNLENVVLTGNPLSTVVDYRVKVLERFNDRAPHICLDNEQSSQQELDTVAVLQALRFVKEGRSPNIIVQPSYLGSI